MEQSYLKMLGLLLLLIPFWWVLGSKVFIFHVVVAFLFFYMLFSLKKSITPLKVFLPHKFLIVFIIISLSSLMLNINIQENKRIIASIYNLSYWLMGLMVMILLQNIKYDKNSILKFLNVFRCLGIIQGILAIISLVYWYKFKKGLEINSLLLSIFTQIGEFELLKDSMVLNIVRVDWLFGNAVGRLTGLFVYPTALAIGMVIIIFLSLIYYKEKKAKKIKVTFELLIMFVPLIYSQSRTALLAMLVSIFLVNVFNFPKDRRRFLYISIISWCSILLIPFVYLVVDGGLEWLLNSREGSTNLRAQVYLLAISTALDNPLLGIGVKYELPGYHIPIGSHSTHIGILLKSGFLGYSFFLLFLLSIVVYWINSKKYLKTSFDKSLWNYFGMAFFSVTLWTFTEDIDAPQIVALFYFIVCGFIVRLQSVLRE